MFLVCFPYCFSLNHFVYLAFISPCLPVSLSEMFFQMYFPVSIVSTTFCYHFLFSIPVSLNSLSLCSIESNFSPALLVTLLLPSSLPPSYSHLSSLVIPPCLILSLTTAFHSVSFPSPLRLSLHIPFPPVLYLKHLLPCSEAVFS